MDSAKAFLALLTVAAVAGPGMGLAYRVIADPLFAYAVLNRAFVLGLVAGAFLCLKQLERVYHLKREDQLDRRFLSQAAESQMRVAFASEQHMKLGSGTGGDVAAEVMGLYQRGRGALPGGQETIDAEARGGA